MKLTVEKEQIIDGLQKASAILPAKAGAAYLRSLWLKAEEGQLSIMATDANIEFTGTYSANVEEQGLIGVQGRAFADIVRLLPAGPMSITVDKEASLLQLKQGRKIYKLPVNSPDWFQPLSPYPDSPAITWSGDVFSEILDKIPFCISNDDSLEATACLCFKAKENGKVDSCGLNGHQFALYSFIHDELCAALQEDDLLIQQKYLQDIKKWLGPSEIELKFSDKHLFIKGQEGAEILAIPRVHSAYPDYSQFMTKLEEDKGGVLTLSRKEAISALGRICVFNTDTLRSVMMEMSEKDLHLTVKGSDSGSGSEELEIDYTGNIKCITFPTKHLMEIFEHFSSEHLNVKFTNTEGPCGITGNEDINYLVIIMPMRVSEDAYYTEDDE